MEMYFSYIVYPSTCRILPIPIGYNTSFAYLNIKFQKTLDKPTKNLSLNVSKQLEVPK